MGPLVPDVIGNELNFVVALFIGIAFGFILEQAGFSSSKKLVGLFYGYDFTVLRVFFTAGVTAMIGVIVLGHFGLLDVSLIYINPTFLWSALIGGVIMGLGFVIGGFCPGTSVCAAAIGKIDAMVFVAGSFIGVLLFAEGYPLLEGLYKAESWGNVRIFETLGMSQALFAFMLTVVAVGAFWAVTMVEAKVNGKPNPEFANSRPLYTGITAAAILIGLSAFVLPDRKEDIANLLNDENVISSYSPKFITSDELAFRIIDNDETIQIFDFRTFNEFSTLNLPKSTNIQLSSLFEKDTQNKLSLKDQKNVFIAGDEVTARRAAFAAEELGYSDVYILKGGMESFKKAYLAAQPEKTESLDTNRFRIQAASLIPDIIKENMAKKGTQVKKQSKRVLGGC